MSMQEMLSDYKQPGGKWVEEPLTRPQKKRLIQNLNKYKVDYEEDELLKINRSQGQHLFEKIGEIRRNEKEKKVAEQGEKKKKKKKKGSLLSRIRQ